MTKYVSPATVISALRLLKNLQIRRAGRTSLLGFLLLKAKQQKASGQWIEVSSKGANSVATELEKYVRIAPGTLMPDLNPFGSHDGGLEYLVPEYERRGTYTHLYPGRNLYSVVDVQKTASGKAFEVRIPRTSASNVQVAAGTRIPLEPTAAFFMRRRPFVDTATAADVVNEFCVEFDLDASEVAALFEHGSFMIDFAPTPLPDGIGSLPADLQPKLPSASHGSAARASHSVLKLAERSGDITLSDKEMRRIERAFQASRAIALLGPPGTGKSAMLAQVLESAATNPSSLGMTAAPSYRVVTADADWTSRTVIGGYYPTEEGQLVFREGALLQAIANNEILWIDEMNRADLDRVLGPVMTFLTGQPVDLGLTHLGAERDAKSMMLVWANGAESGVREDEKQRLYYAGSDWRLLGTYNNVDRGRVFPMGSALQRRWALVPIAPVDGPAAAAALENAGVRQTVSAVLLQAYELHKTHLPIGLAPFLDIARYVGSDETVSDTDPLTQEERNLLSDGYILFLGQQLSRLDPSEREEFFDALGAIFGADLADEAASF